MEPKIGRKPNMMNLKNLLAFTAISLFASAALAKTEMYYVHSDHLGTPQVLTDKDQQVVWRRSQTPFGETVEKSGTVIQPLRFPGQYEDPETGFHYNYFRDYDPASGRYMQSDPIGLEGGMNTYGYVFANPLFFIDPFGLNGQMSRHKGRQKPTDQTGGVVGVWGCISGGCVDTSLPGQPGRGSASLSTTLVGGGVFICSRAPNVSEDCDNDKDGLDDKLDDDGIPDVGGFSTPLFGSTWAQNGQWCIYIGPSFSSPITVGEGVRYE